MNEKKALSPLSPAYLRGAAGEMRDLRSLTLAALIIALSIVVSSVFITVGDNLRIYFTFVFTMLGAMIYGPFVALAAGLASDLLGFFIHPSGPFFFGYTLSAMLGPLIYALCLYRCRVSVLRVALAKLAVNLAVNVLLGSLWSAMMYGKGYYYYLAKSVVKNLLMLPIEVVMFVALFQLLLPALMQLRLIPPQRSGRISLW